MDSADAILTAAVAAVVIAFVVWAVVRAHRAKPYTGAESMVGADGEAITDINPKGQVFVHGEYWRAKSDTPIRKGEEIKVVSCDGLWLVVAPKAREVGDGSDHD